MGVVGVGCDEPQPKSRKATNRQLGTPLITKPPRNTGPTVLPQDALIARSGYCASFSLATQERYGATLEATLPWQMPELYVVLSKLPAEHHRALLSLDRKVDETNLSIRHLTTESTDLVPGL